MTPHPLELGSIPIGRPASILIGRVTSLTPHRSSLPYLWRWAHVFHVPVIGVLLLWGCLYWRLWRGRRADACTEGAGPGMLPAFARGAADAFQAGTAPAAEKNPGT